jgi:hypothetical protein
MIYYYVSMISYHIISHQYQGSFYLMYFYKLDIKLMSVRENNIYMYIYILNSYSLIYIYIIFFV